MDLVVLWTSFQLVLGRGLVPVLDELHGGLLVERVELCDVVEGSNKTTCVYAHTYDKQIVYIMQYTLCTLGIHSRRERYVTYFMCIVYTKPEIFTYIRPTVNHFMYIIDTYIDYRRIHL